MPPKFIDLLEKAKKNIHLADHMTYMTFPLVQDNKLLFKILEQLNSGLVNVINSILQYEYLYKRIQLSQDKAKNLDIFKQKCSIRYTITNEEIQDIIKIFNLHKKHKESGFEFIKNGKVIIMSDNLQTESITLEKTKQFLNTAKSVLKKVERKIKGD